MCGCCLLLVWRQLDHIVDPENRNGSFGGKSNRFDLGNHRLEDTGLQVVSWSSVEEIQPAVLQFKLLFVGLALLLGGGVQHSEFGHQFGGVFRCVGG